MDIYAMNPDIDMDEVYKIPHGKDKVVLELLNEFNQTANFFSPQPKPETLKAFIVRALDMGFKFKQVRTTIRKVPELFDKFPSFIAFCDIARSNGGYSNHIDEYKPSTFIEDMLKEAKNIENKLGADKLDLFVRSYAKGVYGLNLNEISDKKDLMTALAVYDWRACSFVMDIQKIYEHGIRTTNEAKVKKSEEIRLEVKKISERLIAAREK